MTSALEVTDRLRDEKVIYVVVQLLRIVYWAIKLSGFITENPKTVRRNARWVHMVPQQPGKQGCPFLTAFHFAV